jgi:long-chain acyl-CoA synthetase
MPLDPGHRASFSATTLQSLAGNLATHGEKDAILFFEKGREERWAYAQLAEDTERLAHGLASHGIGRGERLAICARNRPEWIVVCLATLRSGAVPVLLDTQLSEGTLRHVLRDSGARRLFTTSAEVDRLRGPCEEAGVEIVVLDHENGARESERSWRSLLAQRPGELPSVRDEDVAVLFYTSGTTGPPKGVPLSHRNLTFQIRTIAEADLVGEDDRVLLPLPLHHVYPFVVGMLTPLALGLPLVIPSAFTGPQIVEALQRGQATLLIGVPRLYEALVSGLEARAEQQGRLAKTLYANLLALSILIRRGTGSRLGSLVMRPLRKRIAPHLRIVVSGGAALKADVGWRLEGLGWLVATGYGLTETAPLLTINRPGNLRFATAGHPVPGVELRIDKEAAPRGMHDDQDAGEVLARGPEVFSGYLNLPDKTAEAFTDDGWFRTGDLGFIDDRGDLHLVGRRSTVIVTESGENVQPDAVEDAYQQHPAIGEIAVLGRNGRLVGLIVPRAGTQHGADAEAAVRRAVEEVSQRLPSHQRLAEFALTRDAIPRTRLGKPQRHLLAERYEQALQGDTGDAPHPKGPMPPEEMSAEDRTLLEDPAAAATWELLAGRFADRRLSPDSDLNLDLGIDSMEWLNISLEISQRTGVGLGEDTIARVRTVRDLLAEVAGGAGKEMDRGLLEEPEAALSDEQRRWLRPLGPVLQAVAFCVYWLNRGVMRSFFRLRCSGLEFLPAERPFLLTPNHTSFLDPLALAASLDYSLLRNTYWAGWTGIVFKNALRRAAARLAQVVPIDPERGAASSLAFGAAVLQRKMALVWFPEGARSGDGSLQPFKPGIGLLLQHCPVPVVPVVIRGAYAAWPRHHSLPRLAPIEVRVHPPVDPELLEQRGSGETPSQCIVDALHGHVAGLLEPA